MLIKNPVLLSLTAPASLVLLQADDSGGVPWWVWLLIILILLILVYWWWQGRSEASDEVAGPQSRTPVSTFQPPVAEAETPPPAEPIVEEAPPEPPVVEEVAPPERDDLKRIEGIGPKISSVLRQAGIMTFAQLSETDAAQLEQLIRDAGIRLAQTDTWPEQEKLAAAGDWEALETLQDELKGGRRA